MCCFLDCTKAENVNENWDTSSSSSLNLKNLVISKSSCGQAAPSNNNLPRESGLESFFDSVFKSAHIGGLKITPKVEIRFTTENLKV